MIEQRIRDFISIDIGSINTMIYVAGMGVVFNEPTVLVYDADSDEVVAIGEVASKMVGKTHERLRVVRPVVNGAIADDVALEAYFRYIFHKLNLLQHLPEIRVLVPISPNLSKVDVDSFTLLLEKLGVKNIFLENKLKLAALGSGVDIYRANGSFVIDLGGGTVSMGVVSLGDVVSAKTINIGGEAIDIAIVKYIREKYNLAIHRTVAEKIKWISSLYLVHENRVMDVSGLDLIEEKPRQVQITTSELKFVLVPILQRIIEAAKEVFSQTPPSLVSDIIKSGITLVGGTALLEGVQEYIQNSLGVEARVSINPMLAVLEGTRLYEPHLIPFGSDDVDEEDLDLDLNRLPEPE